MNYSLKIVKDTWLKRSTTEQAANLPDNEKHALQAGQQLSLLAYDLAGNYLKVTFGANSMPLPIGGYNTWYAWMPDVQVWKDGAIVSFTSSGGINANGLKLIKAFEGCVLHAYQDSVGVWTIGYGTTSGVYSGMQITQQQAEDFLQKDLQRFEVAVRRSITVPLNDDQFAALVSFTYNLGEGALQGSTLQRLLNAGDYSGAADQFLRWNQAGGQVLDGLTRRRRAERALFLSQDFTVYL